MSDKEKRRAGRRPRIVERYDKLRLDPLFELPQMGHLWGSLSEGDRNPDLRQPRIRGQFAEAMELVISAKELYERLTNPAYGPLSNPGPFPGKLKADDKNLKEFLELYAKPEAELARIEAWIEMSAQPPSLMLVRAWDEFPAEDAITRATRLMNWMCLRGPDREWKRIRDYWKKRPANIVDVIGDQVLSIPGKVDEVVDPSLETRVYAAFVILLKEGLPTRRMLVESLASSPRGTYKLEIEVSSLEKRIGEACKNLGLG